MKGQAASQVEYGHGDECDVDWNGWARAANDRITCVRPFSW